MTAKTIFHPSVNRLFDASPLANFFDGDPRDFFRVDIEEADGEYHIRADLPGVKKDDVKINVEDNVLTISAEFARPPSEDSKKTLRRERASGKRARQFILSPDVQADSINATMDNGVLTLALPKGENKRRRQINIS